MRETIGIPVSIFRCCNTSRDEPCTIQDIAADLQACRKVDGMLAQMIATVARMQAGVQR